MNEKPSNYRIPAELASRLRTTARTNDMEFQELTKRLITLGLVIDKTEIDGGSTLIKTGEVEDRVRVIKDRNLFQKFIDRFGVEKVKPESAYTIKIPALVNNEVQQIAGRERMSPNRVIEEILNQGLEITTRLASPDSTMVIRDPGLEEKVLQVTIR